MPRVSATFSARINKQLHAQAQNEHVDDNIATIAVQTRTPRKSIPWLTFCFIFFLGYCIGCYNAGGAN